MKRALILLLVMVLPVCYYPVDAQGGTYYVDPSGSDDTGDGSLGDPWKSIVYAASQLTTGDTLLINPGTYQGGILVEVGGTAGNPVTFRANGAGVIIEGSGGERDAFFIDQADYIVVEGLTIQGADRAGVRISWSDHVSVRDCTFADNGVWGLFTDFSNYTFIENVESYGAVEEHGIYISNSSDYPTIRGSRIHHNYANGIHMNGDISMGGDGVISYGLIEGNTIYENGLGGGSGINMDGVSDTMVRNNLLYENHASGISIYQIDGGSGSMNNRVLNNTIVMAADGRWAINIPDINDTGNKLFNNILYNHHPWRGSITIASPVLPGFESDYNVVMDRFSSDGGDTRVSFTQWQALGYDLHSFISTPEGLFVDPSGNNYHLKPDSPAIDKGRYLNDVTEDLEGHPRPAGKSHDIGAYEFSPTLDLYARGGDGLIRLTWLVDTPLPVTSTWQIAYQGPPGDEPSPISGISNPTRAYTLTGLSNYMPYTITLNAMLDSTPVLTDTVTVITTDIYLFLPMVVADNPTTQSKGVTR